MARGGRAFPSQSAFRAEMLALLHREERSYALGGRRLRHLLIDAPGIRLHVRYALRPTRRPLLACPVCGSDVRPIRNRTLFGDEVTLGYRCHRCGYWTHLVRKVPVRYRFLPGSSGRSPARPTT